LEHVRFVLPAPQPTIICVATFLPAAATGDVSSVAIEIDFIVVAEYPNVSVFYLR
jgi:hypothetical protein